MGQGAEPSGAIVPFLSSALPFRVPARRSACVSRVTQQPSPALLRKAHGTKQSVSLPFIPRPHSPSPARQSSEPRPLEPAAGSAQAPMTESGTGTFSTGAVHCQPPFDPHGGMKTSVNCLLPAPLEAAGYRHQSAPHSCHSSLGLGQGHLTGTQRRLSSPRTLKRHPQVQTQVENVLK